MHLDVTLSSLRSLIGRKLELGGEQCQIVDVLEDSPALVLKVVGQNSIQPDQWGDAHRRTPETITIDVFERDGQTLDRRFSALWQCIDQAG